MVGADDDVDHPPRRALAKRSGGIARQQLQLGHRLGRQIGDLVDAADRLAVDQDHRPLVAGIDLPTDRGDQVADRVDAVGIDFRRVDFAVGAKPGGVALADDDDRIVGAIVAPNLLHCAGRRPRRRMPRPASDAWPIRHVARESGRPHRHGVTRIASLHHAAGLCSPGAGHYQAARNASHIPTKPKVPMSITISSAFDAGNIRVSSISGDTADLEIVTDHLSDFYQWFHFKLAGAGGREVTLAHHQLRQGGLSRRLAGLQGVHVARPRGLGAGAGHQLRRWRADDPLHARDRLRVAGLFRALFDGAAP